MRSSVHLPALSRDSLVLPESAGIKDRDGTILTLTQSENGIWQSGSYYELVKSEIERSLNNFLFDTSFPYDASASAGKGGFGGHGGTGGPGGMGGQMPGGNMGGRGGFAQ